MNNKPINTNTIMKKIYSAAINMANAQELKTSLVESINKVDVKNSPIIERFIDTIFGCDITMDELPKVKYNSSYGVMTLESASYLSDEVIFNYNSVDTRYFENQEDADKYAETGDFDYSKSNYNKTETYTIKASHKFARKSNYSFEWWLSQQDVEPTYDVNTDGTTN